MVRIQEPTDRSWHEERRSPRVNAVSPGLVATPYWDRLRGDARKAMYERSAATVPVDRVGSPADIAEAVLFLATNTFTTGAIIDRDGGARLV
jgi:NAD(P)-dependent dehydrogenase (short-subunit alcohol dehydrogenase family)